MQMGVRIGIDVGKVRIGIAKSDPTGFLASPLETVKRDNAEGTHIRRILDIANEHAAEVIYVGDPINLKGESTLSTHDANLVALDIAKLFREVRLIDERLSTVTAQSRLGAGGKNVKSARSIIDQAAAAILLQQALDIERASGKMTGVKVCSETQTNSANDGDMF